MMRSTLHKNVINNQEQNDFLHIALQSVHTSLDEMKQFNKKSNRMSNKKEFSYCFACSPFCVSVSNCDCHSSSIYIKTLYYKSTNTINIVKDKLFLSWIILNGSDNSN